MDAIDAIAIAGCALLLGLLGTAMMLGWF